SPSVRTIACGVLPKTAGENVMVWGPGMRLASAIASRRLTRPSALFVSSWVVVTTRLALFRTKAACPAPTAVAVTVYWPTVEVAVPIPPALPPATIAVVAERVADGPDVGAAKLMTPPLTGSTGLFAVTATATGLAKAVLTTVVWGVLPATGAIVK